MTANAKASELGQYIPAHYHYQMLADTERMNAFATAIRQRVQPNMRVADLGSGTGVLSFLAAQCGAKVWAVEAVPELAQMSARFLRANNVSDKAQVVMADAATWLPPEPVDIVLCEMLHSALLREKQVAVIRAFRDGHIKQFGCAPLFLPEATLLAVQLVTQDYWYDGYCAPLPLFQSAYADANDCVPRGEPVVYATIDYNGAAVSPLAGHVHCSVPQPVSINAVRFITRNVLALNENTGKTVDWYNQHLIIPLPEPIDVATEQSVAVRFEYSPGDSINVLSDSLRVSVAEMQAAVS